jgi:WD40 repeat protein
MILDSSNLYGASINEKFVSPRDQIVRRDVTSHNGSVSHVLYSSDGLNIYSLGLDNCLRCWDSKTGKHSFRHFPNIASTMRNTRFAIARDEFLFVPSGLQLNQYSTASGGFLQKFNGHFDRICAVAVNPSAGEVYSAGMDRAILVWAEEKGQEIDEKEEKIEKADPAQLSPSLGAANGPLEMSIIHPSLSAQMTSRSAHMEDGDNWSDDER